MADTSEAQTYIERFRDLRAQTLKTLEGMNARQLNWKPTRHDTNSPYVLAVHLLGSERYWIHQVVGNLTIERDRDAEFRARGKNGEALKTAFEEVTRTSDGILGALASTDFDKDRKTNSEGRLRTTRWCVLHMIEHYSEHLGHIQLTRQMSQALVENAKLTEPRAKPKAKGNRKIARRNR